VFGVFHLYIFYAFNAIFYLSYFGANNIITSDGQIGDNFMQNWLCFSIGCIAMFALLWFLWTDTYTIEVIVRGFITVVGLFIVCLFNSYGFLAHLLTWFILIAGVVALIAPMILWRSYE